MAAGDTDVTICNKALLLLGAEPMNSFNDGSTAAQACDTIYTEVKNSTLSMYRWSFSIGKRQLPRDAATPQNEWRYQYVLPNDMLNNVPEAVRVDSTPGALLFKDWDMGQASGGYPVLMTNAEAIHIDYQRTVGEGIMPTYFVTLLMYQMAWHLAEVMTDQVTKSQYWRQVALGNPGEGGRAGYFRQACAIDSGGQTPSVVGDYLLTDVR